eukprot:ctg_511.g286
MCLVAWPDFDADGYDGGHLSRRVARRPAGAVPLPVAGYGAYAHAGTSHVQRSCGGALARLVAAPVGGIGRGRHESSGAGLLHHHPGGVRRRPAQVGAGHRCRYHRSAGARRPCLVRVSADHCGRRDVPSGGDDDIAKGAHPGHCASRVALGGHVLSGAVRIHHRVGGRRLGGRRRAHFGVAAAVRHLVAAGHHRVRRRPSGAADDAQGAGGGYRCRCQRHRGHCSQQCVHAGLQPGAGHPGTAVQLVGVYWRSGGWRARGRGRWSRSVCPGHPVVVRGAAVLGSRAPSAMGASAGARSERHRCRLDSRRLLDVVAARRIRLGHFFHLDAGDVRRAVQGAGCADHPGRRYRGFGGAAREELHPRMIRKRQHDARLPETAVPFLRSPGSAARHRLDAVTHRSCSALSRVGDLLHQTGCYIVLAHLDHKLRMPVVAQVP